VTDELFVRAATSADDVEGWLARSWGGTAMAVHGRLYEAAELPALVAIRDGRLVGLLTYAIEGDELEIVSCDADPPGRGTGGALVEAAVGVARRSSVRRLRCTTTNDNLAALGFWQARGFVLVALRPDAVAAARLLKPTIPQRGYRGLPIRDELDLERRL
jgi:GNAT superfamily N-acetyltransferase